jgi:hypothetical protein
MLLLPSSLSVCDESPEDWRIQTRYGNAWKSHQMCAYRDQPPWVVSTGIEQHVRVFWSSFVFPSHTAWIDWISYWILPNELCDYEIASSLRYRCLCAFSLARADLFMSALLPVDWYCLGVSPVATETRTEEVHQKSLLGLWKRARCPVLCFLCLYHLRVTSTLRIGVVALQITSLPQGSRVSWRPHRYIVPVLIKRCVCFHIRQSVFLKKIYHHVDLCVGMAVFHRS